MEHASRSGGPLPGGTRQEDAADTVSLHPAQLTFDALPAPQDAADFAPTTAAAVTAAVVADSAGRPGFATAACLLLPLLSPLPSPLSRDREGHRNADRRGKGKGK